MEKMKGRSSASYAKMKTMDSILGVSILEIEDKCSCRNSGGDPCATIINARSSATISIKGEFLSMVINDESSGRKNDTGTK